VWGGAPLDMDPISHAVLSGTMVAALEKPDRSRFGRGVIPAVVLGALAPDVDGILAPAGWDIYLRFHEVATHSLTGAGVLGAAAAALVRLVVRGSRLHGLAAAAILSAALHPLFDILSGARIGLAWPFANARISWPLVAMGDPWLIALLATAVGAMWVRHRQLPRAAQAVVVAVAIYFCVKSALYAGARRVAESSDDWGPGASHIFEARWGAWTEWFLFEKRPDALRAWLVSGWSGKRSLVLWWPVEPATPLATASQALDTVRNFRRVHELTFAVERQEHDGQHAVLWSDVRYCRQSIPGRGAPECGLWFGGRFDTNGRPVMQIVEVGAWTQTRPVSP